MMAAAQLVNCSCVLMRACQVTWDVMYFNIESPTHNFAQLLVGYSVVTHHHLSELASG